MTPAVALLVAFCEILATCAIGMGVYGLWRHVWLRRHNADVHTVRSLQPPPRDAVRTYPPFSVSAVDRMVDDTTRGAE